jgi:hypothetical protein
MSSYPVDRSRSRYGVQTKPVDTFPVTWEDWREEYNQRDRRYNGEGYSDEEIERYHLFKALDNSDNLIAKTQQLTRDVQFVSDLAGLTLGYGATLQDGPDGGTATTEAAREMWSRSGLDSGLGLATSCMARLGRVGLEAMLDDDGEPIIVIHQPQHYRVSYDRLRSRITRVAIVIPYYDEPEISPTGEAVQNGTLHTYVRTITESEILTYVDGYLQPDQSGDNPTGAIPFVNCVYMPSGDTAHGLHAAFQLDRAIATYDSLFSQIKAIGNRNGNPLLAAIGAVFGSDGGQAQQLGRILNLPEAGADAKYIEANLSGLKVLLDAADRARLVARETMPEFLFAGAGAGSSGEALRWRASSFERKYAAIRGRLYAQLARLTDIGLAYAENRAYVADGDRLTVTGPPLLPVDVSSALTNLEAAERLGLQRADVVRQLQSLGYVPPKEDPDEYGLESADQRADRALQFFGRQQGEAPTDGEDEGDGADTP